MRANWILIAVALVLTGCQTAEDDLISSPTPVISRSAASAIAGDLASHLAEQVPPAADPMRLKSDQSEFATALKAALKGWGYTIVAEPTSKDTKAVELDYSVQAIDGQLLAQISTPSLALGRAYVGSAGGAAPSSPLSLMKRN